MTTEWTLPSRAHLLPRYMRSMLYRNCSNADDESLVFVSMTNVRAGKTAVLMDVPAEERFRHVFKEVGPRPARLLPSSLR